MATDLRSDETKEAKRSDEDEDVARDEEEQSDIDDNGMLPRLIPRTHQDDSNDDESEGKEENK